MWRQSFEQGIQKLTGQEKQQKENFEAWGQAREERLQKATIQVDQNARMTEVQVLERYDILELILRQELKILIRE